MDKKAKAEEKRARRTQRKLDAENGIAPPTPLPIEGDFPASDEDVALSDDA